MKFQIREATILEASLRLLRIHPRVGWAHRANVGAVRMSGARYVRFGFVGCSDIIGQMRDGRFLAIECKAPRGRVTDDQKAFLERVQRHGGVSGVVRSVQDVDDLLRAA